MYQYYLDFLHHCPHSIPSDHKVLSVFQQRYSLMSGDSTQRLGHKCTMSI